ncbi:Pre-mRNA-splicing factor of RES complex-domain-containing protein [Fusarium solani]|uniref:Pre-mRNA-splicing factor of RES complex-domain-containing protein n=1 Tax=Fusarium solani TaxID=169388 RepID=A0A9P9HQB0_FUSSL|nr:Pre-mRNA-splicing factor of RES complex-domain-containing protein [Fusarium solani]KAH7260604.1 Pre-mRNA-splicing factor of RES complex-domain-containing protein [Fusarium solani]
MCNFKADVAWEQHLNLIFATFRHTMPSDLADYLASRYLVADPKPSKKRKRKRGDNASGGLLIQDDDSGWGNSSAQQDDEGTDAPVTVTGRSAEFRKTKKSNWKSVGEGEGTPKDDSAAAADAILASAAAEQDAARDEDDEMPIVEEGGSVVKMSDGTHAGLQSAAAVSAQLKRRQREEREDFERHRKSAKEEETVYRDATGRRIDISMKRAEARRAAAEAEEKERLAKEALKGEVQLEEARKRREKLQDAKLMSFARTADDEEMNKELKEQERWNDPMMQFMAEKKDAPGKGKKSKRKPVYAGAAPPNRYGIKPGYRWDGVDRSNGFEGERFKAINRRERNKGLDYAWQMDE